MLYQLSYIPTYLDTICVSLCYLLELSVLSSYFLALSVFPSATGTICVCLLFFGTICVSLCYLLVLPVLSDYFLVLTSWDCLRFFFLLCWVQFSNDLRLAFVHKRFNGPLISPFSVGSLSASNGLNLRAFQQLQAQFVPGQGEGHCHPQAVEKDTAQSTTKRVVK